MARAAASADRFDVVVIGGGINGTSAVRELAAAGYQVLLAEKSDLANGASSRSSRILHCGLRYFETHNPLRTFARSPVRLLGAVKMAKAAMASREELVRLRPDRCKPFTMCFPLYRDDDIRGWHLDVGFALLKRLGPANPPLDYRRIRAGIDREIPFAADLRDRGQLRSVARYREYMIDWPDRICVDNALAAERDGASLRLFTRAALRERTSDGDWIVDLSDRAGGGETIRAKVVLNLAGTWVDDVGPVGQQPNQPLVRGTKGSHIVVRLPERYRGYGIATLHRGGMPFYCLPLDGDWFYFGPTETPFDEDADEARPTGDDVDFLLGEANHLLPGLSLGKKDVGFTWAGVRPLTFDPAQPMGRRTREIHDLTARGLPGVLAMTAGPVQSHMSAGRELREAVSKLLPPSRQRAADTVAPATDSAVSIGSQTDRADAYRAAVRDEHARDLRGILYTRTGHAWGRHVDREFVAHVAHSVADLLGWDPAREAGEVDAFLDHQSRCFPTGNAA
ncbi:MAG: FAD-dependent oxidoreductase [Bosea sp.]|uniref:FAD-dependent oxidoreductase n=1 Tax=Bosea sp. (in: a-proteobacteria) TaxID=1871050 RepID=UPI00239750AE|nr:FAD-dependent oxidoreductase [Bosea sp. (in: a-proteobacteria)]MCP4732666.1 FAD-dependent oxidoreductase [Bosea sp. (in: a-proteobacteria)]